MNPALVRLMIIVGGLVVLGGVLYWSFRAIDELGLAERTSAAAVVDKEFRPAGWSSRVEVIGGRPQTVPHHTPDQYVLHLDIEGRAAEHAVDRALYEALTPPDPVQVRYLQRRLTGRLRIVALHR